MTVKPDRETISIVLGEPGCIEVPLYPRGIARIATGYTAIEAALARLPDPLPAGDVVEWSAVDVPGCNDGYLTPMLVHRTGIGPEHG